MAAVVCSPSHVRPTWPWDPEVRGWHMEDRCGARPPRGSRDRARSRRPLLRAGLGSKKSQAFVGPIFSAHLCGGPVSSNTITSVCRHQDSR